MDWSPGPGVQFLCWSPSFKSLEDTTSGLSDRPILDAATLSWDMYCIFAFTRQGLQKLPPSCIYGSQVSGVFCSSRQNSYGGQFAMAKGEESCL